MDFFEMCLAAAQKIAFCDFRVRVLFWGIGDAPPTLKCIIRVGEGRWNRYLVVTSWKATDNPELAILGRTQNNKPIDELDLTRVEFDTTLNELVAESYVGVRRILEANQMEERTRTRGRS